jgi:hypothetical protein
MERSKELENGKSETRSVERVEYCSCCGEKMTHVEVLESYLDQSIEQALEVCEALSEEYTNTAHLQLLEHIQGRLREASNFRVLVGRLTVEGA